MQENTTTERAETMETRELRWTADSVVFMGNAGQVAGCGAVIAATLTALGIDIATDWEAGFPHSAQIARDDWKAIQAAMATAREQQKARMVAYSANPPNTVCPDCGGALNGKTFCDDCGWNTSR